MSNTTASEENTESPSTYGNEAYKEYRKTERKTKRKNEGQGEIIKWYSILSGQ
jgi:hypothetical protein